MGSTIKDIAKDTGLSLATISKYLNNKNISEKNRLLIEESIRRRDYTPNSNAQALRSKSSRCICILMPNIEDYHFGQECDCIMKAMREKGYSTIIRSYSNEPDLAENDISFFKTRRIDGAVLFTQASFPPLLLSYLRSHGLPFICMHEKPGLAADFAGYDDLMAGRIMGEYLFRHGHARILILGLDCGASSRKIEGLLSACRDQEGDPSGLSIVLFPPSELSESRTLPIPTQDAPTAVLFLDHFTSLPLIGSFLGGSYTRQPAYSIAAFDDDDLFSAVTPSITVLSLDAEKLGSQVAELLYHRIQGDLSDFPRNELVSPCLVERNSVKNLKTP